MNRATFKSSLAVMGFVAALTLPGAAGAAIIAGPTLNGYDTFTDQNTGRHWMRLDSFSKGQSYSGMAAAAIGEGFTVGSLTDVHQLLDSLLLDADQWAGYAALMGSATTNNGSFILGAFQPTVQDLINYAYSYDTDDSWTFVFPPEASLGVDDPGNPETDLEFLNLFAFSDAETVPEPAALGLLAGGLIGLARLRRPPARSRGFAPA